MGRRMADGGEIPWGDEAPVPGPVAPVILGDGMRLLSPELGLHGRGSIELTPARVIAAPEVTHIRYKVEGRRPLAAA